jgi:diguanylate cyclase (GGDEF)-like protein/PAS domain S-box-containing protein
MTKAQPSKEMLLSIVNALPIGVFLAGDNGSIMVANPKAEEIFGFNEGELAGNTVDQLIPERHRESHEKMRIDYMNTPSLRAMGHGRILPALTKDKQEIQVEVGLTPITLNEQNYVLVSIIEASNPILKVAAYNDPLTGLPNRNLFIELCENLRNLAIRNGDRLTMMFIDLDNFKSVNDSYGHDVGDQVLCKVADILHNSIRINDVAGRIGGDEFLICLYGIKSIIDIKTISNNIIRKISDIRYIEEKKIDISASIGAVSAALPNAMSLDEMIKKSDKAMYKAKKSGKGNVFSEGS